MLRLNSQNVIIQYAKVLSVVFFIIFAMIGLSYLSASTNPVHGDTTNISADNENEADENAIADYDNEEAVNANEVDMHDNGTNRYNGEGNEPVIASYMVALEQFLMDYEIFFINPWGTMFRGLEETIAFNPQGQRIYEAPFILGENAFRLGFDLFDLDGDGIPEVLVRSGVLETCHTWTDVFAYRDGEYKYVGWMLHNHIQRDTRGTLLQQCWWSNRVFYVRFDGSAIQSELYIGHVDGDFRRLFNFHTEQFFTDASHTEFLTYFNNLNEIRGFPHTPIVRVMPLTELQEYITEIVTRRLIDEGRILEEWVSN